MTGNPRRTLSPRRRDDARAQAEKDTSGVYCFLLRMVPPALAIERLLCVMTQMFNFGRPRLVSLEKGPRSPDLPNTTTP